MLEVVDCGLLHAREALQIDDEKTATMPYVMLIGEWLRVPGRLERTAPKCRIWRNKFPETIWWLADFFPFLPFFDLQSL